MLIATKFITVYNILTTAKTIAVKGFTTVSLMLAGYCLPNC